MYRALWAGQICKCMVVDDTLSTVYTFCGACAIDFTYLCDTSNMHHRILHTHPVHALRYVPRPQCRCVVSPRCRLLPPMVEATIDKRRIRQPIQAKDQHRGRAPRRCCDRVETRRVRSVSERGHGAQQVRQGTTSGQNIVFIPPVMQIWPFRVSPQQCPSPIIL